MPLQTDPGPFLSALGFAGNVGQIPLQLLRGRPGAAGRKLVDVLGDIPDALLPGDWIPHVGDEDPRAHFSDVAGVDRDAHPGIAKAVDIVGDAALNPLSYVGLRGGAIKYGRPLTEGAEIAGTRSAIDRAKAVLGSGYDRLPEGLRDGVKATGAKIRQTMNWLDVPDEGMANLKQAKGEGYQAGRSGTEEAQRAYADLTPEERIAVGQLGHQVRPDPLVNGPNAFAPIGDTPQDVDNFINSLAGQPNIRPDVVRQAYLDHMNLSRAQESGLNASNAFQRRFDVNGQAMSLPDLKRQMAMDQKSGAFPPTGTVDDYARARGFTELSGANNRYMQRQYDPELFEDPSLFAPQAGGSAPSAMKGRVEALKTPQGLAKWLTETPEAGLDFDVRNVDMRRAAQQGRIIEKQKLMKGLEPDIMSHLKQAAQETDNLGQPTTAANEAAADLASLDNGISLSSTRHQQLFKDAVDRLNKDQPDYAYRLKNAWTGIAPRGDSFFDQGLYQANKLFKGAATGGVGVPRPGFNVRNRLAGSWQVLSNDAARGTIGSNAKRILSDFMGAVDDMWVKWGGSRFSGSEMTKELDHIEDAFKQSGGDTGKLRQIISQHPNGKYMQEALDNGVLDNFVSSENLLENMARSAKGKKLVDIAQAPQAMTQGIEQRLRYGTFKDLREKGVPPERAAKISRETYLDYDIPGIENRRFRDWVPFGAFLSQNLKQQAGFVARHPVVATTASGLFSDDENGPKYPYLDNQISIPTGLNEKGNPQYLTSFGLPLEQLTSVPGFNPTDAYRDLAGNLQPFAKTALAAVVGKDPFTGQDFGENDKLFGHHAGKLGRGYNNVKATGLLQPITGPVDQIQQMLDDRRGLGEKALQYGTGARFVDVDPDQAKRQRLEQYLNANPDVQQYTGYFQEKGHEDPGLTDLLSQLNEAKAKLKAKRLSAASVL